jgi:hypothetical protein
MPAELPSVVGQARKDVPAVKYAVAAAAVGATFAWLSGHFPDAKTAVLGTLSMFVLMLLMIVIARAATMRGNGMNVPALAITWTVVLVFVAGVVLLFASIFFDKPKPFREIVAMFASDPAKRADVQPPQQQQQQTVTATHADIAAVAPQPAAAKPCDPECRVRAGAPVQRYGPMLTPVGYQVETVFPFAKSLPIPRYVHVFVLVDPSTGASVLHNVTLSDSQTSGDAGVATGTLTPTGGARLIYRRGDADYSVDLNSSDGVSLDAVIRRVGADD